MKAKLSLSALFIAIAGLQLSGCAHINGIMRSWEGHHYSEVIGSWGPPQQVFEDGAGGRILVYSTNRAWVVPGTATTQTTFSATAYDDYIWGTATSRTVYTPAQVQGYTAYRMFWIDRSGRIYRWAWRGV